LLFIACTFKPVVEHDGIGYFAYLQSIFVDRDLDLSDEYAAAQAARTPGYLPFEPTATGLLPDFFPVGPALLSAPAYLLALLLRPGGERQFGWPFTLAYVLASIFYGLLALALSYRLACAVTNSRRAAALGVTAAAVAKPFVYYLVFEPSYSHTFSAFAVAAFLFFWWRTRRQRSTTGWLLLGVRGGVMRFVRWQDGPLIARALLGWWRAGCRPLLSRCDVRTIDSHDLSGN
jgi:hypothetical protein